MPTPLLTRLSSLALALVVTLGPWLSPALALDTRDDPTRAEAHAALMRAGRTALRRDQPEEAIPRFSAAWRLAPRDPGAQLALAEALARNGQVQRAEALLSHLLDDPAQRANEPLYLDALAKLKKRRPFLVSGGISLVPSTNINNASSSETFRTLLGTFDIDNDREESGVGLEMGVNGTYRHPLDNGLTLALHPTLKRVWYRDPLLQHWRGRLALDLRRIGALREWTLGLHADRTLYPDREEPVPDRIIYGLHAAWSRLLTDRDRLHLSGVLEHRDYIDRDTLSGPYASVRLGWSRELPDRARARAGIVLERSLPELDYHRYHGAGLNLGYSRPLTRTIRAGLSASALLRRFDSDFAAVDYARRDEIWSVGFSVSDTRLQILGATPRLSCTHERRNSNVALYSREATDCRLGWTYRF